MFKQILLLIFFTTFLSGCATEKNIIISTNNYTQTNYDYNCLSGDKTFTQIIICYQKQDKAEKAQNKLTNEMIKNANLNNSL